MDIKPAPQRLALSVLLSSVDNFSHKYLLQTVSVSPTDFEFTLSANMIEPGKLLQVD